MLKIGDFSRLAQVPVATLRYYDQLGLLRPARIDTFSDYRYYTVDQLPKLNRILALKDLGFSLDQIARMVQTDIRAEELRGMLRMRQADAERELVASQARLARVEARLREIEDEGRPPRYDVVLKSIEPQWMLSTRRLVPSAEDMMWMCDDLHDRLRGWMRSHAIRALDPPAPQMVNLYFNSEYTEVDLDLEAGVLVPKSVSPSARAMADAPMPIAMRELEGHPLAACGVHQGAMQDLKHLIQGVLMWVGANGYAPAGPVRELHLAGRHGDPPDKRIVEIQVPVTAA